MRKPYEIFSACLMSGVLSLSVLPWPLMASEEEESTDDHPTEKTETVYTFIDPDGTINETIVSSWLHDEDGIDGIEEQLSLNDVQNVKGTQQPSVSGNTYTWSVDGNDVYYEGTASKKPPVTVSITYELDGKKVKASQLNGKSGHLKMTVHFSNPDSKTVDVNGKQVTIHPLFLAGGLMDLDGDVFSNVVCEQGKSINDGDKQFLLFASLPGLNDTLEQSGLDDLSDKLDLSDDVTIEADVTDYETPEMYMALTNNIDMKDLPELDSLDDLDDSLEELFSSSKELVDGSDQLAQGTLALKEGIEPLVSGVAQMPVLTSAVDALYAGSVQLDQGVASYTSGVDQLASSTNGLYAISDGIGQVQSAVDTSLKTGAGSLSDGLAQVESQLNGMDASSLDGLKTQLDQAQQALAGLGTILDTDMNSLAGLSSALDSAIAAGSAIETQMTSAITGLSTTIAADSQVIAADNEAIAAAASGIESQKQQASASLDSASQALAQLQADNPDVDFSALSSAISAAQSSVQAIQAPSGLQSLSGFSETDLANFQSAVSSISSLKDQLSAASSTLTSLKADLNTASGTLQALKTQLDGVDTSEEYTALMNKLSALKSAISQLSAGSKSLYTGILSLDSSLSTLQSQSKSAFDQLGAAAGQISSFSSSLNDGSSQLASGMSQMKSSTSSLETLADGVNTLSSAVDTLNEGAQTLSEGMSQFDEEGMGTLKSMTDWGKDEIEAFKTLCDKSADFNETYSNFAGAPKGAKTSATYIFKVEKDDES